MVRVGPISAIPTLLEAAGVDSAALLAEVGLDRGFFSNPENLIGLPTVGAIMERCVARTNCPHFGLLVGRSASTTSFGLLGYLMMSSPTVGAALRELVGHMEVHDRSAVATLRVEGELATLGYTILVNGVAGRSQIHDAAIAIAFNLLRTLCGSDWRLSAVQLAHARPALIDPYVAHFGVTPYFGAEFNSLVFYKRWLNQPLSTFDPVLNGLMRERIGEIEAHRLEDLVGQVRRILTPLIGTTGCTLEAVASELGMSGRTLNRRLADHQLTFRDLLEEVHFEAASQLLKDTRMSAREIAQILGYSDGSAFSRAFTRWADVGPIQWRRSSAAGRTKGDRSDETA
jgi:AraC-like DNA-binding protein